MTLNAENRPRLVHVDGSTVRILTRDDHTDHRPLLLINGLGARLEAWEPFATELRNRRLLMFDLPGISGRPAHSLPLDMTGLAAWLTHLMDVLEIPEADVLGYSWGGVLAQQLARDTPSRVSSLVLAATNFGSGGSIPIPNMASLTNFIRHIRGDDPWKLLNLALGGRPGALNPVGAVINALNPTTSTTEGYQRQLLALVGWTSLPWLKDLRSPTLVIASIDDPYVPTSTTRILAQAIPGARLELVSGAGHLLLTNQAARMARIVTDFLNHIDPPGHDFRGGVNDPGVGQRSSRFSDCSSAPQR